MKKNNERVLAYQLAKSISKKELMEIAGGQLRNAQNVTFATSHRAASAFGKARPQLDGTIDF